MKPERGQKISLQDVLSRNLKIVRLEKIDYDEAPALPQCSVACLLHAKSMNYFSMFAFTLINVIG